MTDSLFHVVRNIAVAIVNRQLVMHDEHYTTSFAFCLFMQTMLTKSKFIPDNLNLSISSECRIFIHCQMSQMNYQRSIYRTLSCPIKIQTACQWFQSIPRAFKLCSQQSIKRQDFSSIWCSESYQSIKLSIPWIFEHLEPRTCFRMRNWEFWNRPHNYLT